jgi:hypothetical protein
MALTRSETFTIYMLHTQEICRMLVDHSWSGKGLSTTLSHLTKGRGVLMVGQGSVRACAIWREAKVYVTGEGKLKKLPMPVPLSDRGSGGWLRGQWAGHGTVIHGKTAWWQPGFRLLKKGLCHYVNMV